MSLKVFANISKNIFKKSDYQYADNATVAGLADKPESLARSFYSCEYFLTCHLGFEKSVQTGIKCAKYPCTVMSYKLCFVSILGLALLQCSNATPYWVGWWPDNIAILQVQVL